MSCNDLCTAARLSLSSGLGSAFLQELPVGQRFVRLGLSALEYAGIITSTLRTCEYAGGKSLATEQRVYKLSPE